MSLSLAPAEAQPSGSEWRSIATGPLRPRQGAASVWTGREMIVLGGTLLVEVTDPAKVEGSSTHLDGSRFGVAVRYRRDVAAYDPARDRWRTLAPMPRVPVSAWSTEGVVWTGSEIVVPLDAAVLVYEVANNAWRSVPYPEPKPEPGGAVVWTGSDVLFWGYPYHLPGSTPWAHAFTPGADTWRAFDPGPLGFREFPAAAWTGNEMVVFGGRSANDLHAAAYDPATNTWRALAPTPPASFHTLDAFWTGREVIAIESGFGQDGMPIGIAYNPGQDTWRTISALGGIARAEYALAWTGSEVLVVDGSLYLPGSDERARAVGTANAYNPTTDAWRSLPKIAGEVTCASTLVWTGDAAIVWGGNRGCRIQTRPRPTAWSMKG